MSVTAAGAAYAAMCAKAECPEHVFPDPLLNARIFNCYQLLLPVDGELPVVPKRRLTEPVTAVIQPGPNPYGCQASVGTRSRLAFDISRGAGAWLEPTSRKGHAAIGV